MRWTVLYTATLLATVAHSSTGSPSASIPFNTKPSAPGVPPPSEPLSRSPSLHHRRSPQLSREMAHPPSNPVSTSLRKRTLTQPANKWHWKERTENDNNHYYYYYHDHAHDHEDDGDDDSGTSELIDQATIDLHANITLAEDALVLQETTEIEDKLSSLKIFFVRFNTLFGWKKGGHGVFTTD
ncbi:hypothetical protein BJ085DRAFT_38456 [Dimargaris cristalligena]|uniref:Uncharacterized protein n=1 Tax=Dimargaris cristalligena TaxID=215637 RepID=A0A4Q0A273_9FUNG|nr:hypothetical protein BJ085DRAFT_38456 [Dimargaris cristalligena]|eukprot:RKP39270.1 hypothetical protein BJ085DRAFT_38456 [Dimargaris cristalligena]